MPTILTQFVLVRLSAADADIEKCNWHLSNGWGIVDRFELDGGATIVMFGK